MTVKEQKETRGFQAQVKQLLHLVTHALYSNKEIFLRELISNASDAADKLRFEALQDNALYENDSDLKIRIMIDKDAKTITIMDNGIGMNREEVIENLGTIAQSGTKEFLSHLTGDQAKDSNLIGQFGVGFYSSFIIADKVIVKTRRAGMQPNQGVYWESDGEGDYVIKNIQKIERGTEVVLHLRNGDEEFLDEFRLRQIILKYSDHIMLPIWMKKPDLSQKTEEEKQKKPEKAELEEEIVNRATALWTLSKKDIKKADYIEFYKHIAHDSEEPLAWAHHKVEGKLEYTSLLYIPARAPFDLFARDKKQGLKLYVRRVFIMEDAEQLLPNYLRFVRGIVDSNDLPLNISREILQNNKIIDSIRSGCSKRILEMLSGLSKDKAEKYRTFWKEFGKILKEGLFEDFANRDQIAPLLRFASTHDDLEEQHISLHDYLKRMPESQQKIYYITADSFKAAKNSPHLEIFRKKGIEVLLLYDRVDEWVVNHLTEFEGKPLQSVAKGDIGDIGGKEAEQEKSSSKQENKEEFESFISQIKKALEGKVKDVRLTNRLTDSPACLISDQNEMSIHLQNMLKAAGQDFGLNQQPILEINPEHKLIQKMKTEADEERFTQWVWTLFEQAQLAQGMVLEDPANFVKRLNALLVE